MVRRVTISIDDKIESVIRQIQAKKISDTKRSVSFSRIVSLLLKEGLKSYNQIRMGG